jgi:hypothetical protein
MFLFARKILFCAAFLFGGNMKKIKMLAVAALFALTGSLFAQTVEEIMAKSTDLPVPIFSKALLIMELVDKNGKVTETRKIYEYGNVETGLKNVVFDIQSPASVKDTRILQAEKIGKGDDKWIYLPSLKTTRRIAAAERQKSWVGSDLTYNDMTIRKFDDDEQTMLDENASQNSNGKAYKCWKIKSVPVKNKNVEYAYRIQFIEKGSYLPIMVEYYDKKDTLIKTYGIDAFEEFTGATGKKYWLRRHVTMKNVLTGHYTTVAVDKIEFDKPVATRYFTQNWLNTGK